MRKCYLVNYKTGKKINSKSVTSFCKLAGLNKVDKNATIHIYSILNEKRFEHLGWCLPKYYYMQVKLKDIYGNIYSGKIYELAKNFNISERQIYKLVTKRKLVINGISLLETECLYSPLNPLKLINVKLMTPNNRIIRGKTIKSLNRQIGIDNVSYRSLLDLIHGKSLNVKGYNVIDLEFKKKFSLNEKMA